MQVDNIGPEPQKVLDRKFTTLSRLIRETRPQRPTFSEVIGGIGYVFGLMGVALYFMTSRWNYRRNRLFGRKCLRQ